MLTENGIKQEVSFLYLHALTTRLGYALERVQIDMDSVDATICARGIIPRSTQIISSPKIDVQQKTSRRDCCEDPVPFNLSKKNYDDLSSTLYNFWPADPREAFDDFIIFLRVYSCRVPMNEQKNNKSANALPGDAAKNCTKSSLRQSQKMNCEALQEMMIKVTIQDCYFPSITRIGQKLKPQTEINQDEFVGKVLALQGVPDESGTMQGEATLIILLDEQQAKAKVFLDPTLYSQACDAHKYNKYVRVSGILCEKPRCSDLTDISLFEVLSLN